jgi:hypothetical protein
METQTMQVGKLYSLRHGARTLYKMNEDQTLTIAGTKLNSGDVFMCVTKPGKGHIKIPFGGPGHYATHKHVYEFKILYFDKVFSLTYTDEDIEKCYVRFDELKKNDKAV